MYHTPIQYVHIWLHTVESGLLCCVYAEEKLKGKGPVESEGFMNALSSQAAKMKEKKRKVSKVRCPHYVSTHQYIAHTHTHTHTEHVPEAF